MALIELLPWQRPSSDKLVEILSHGPVALNASETGTGKTYVAIDVLKRLNRKALVITPKSVVTSWHRVAASMGASDRLLAVLNVESLKAKAGRGWYSDKTWHLAAPNNMIVWDEVHKGASGPKTQTTEMLGFTKVYKVPVLAQSATIADNPLKMRGLGFLLGLHDYNPSSFYRWCRQHGCFNSPFHTGLEFTRGAMAQQHMKAIHEAIRDRMVRIRIDEVPEFPECETLCNLYDLDAAHKKEVDAIYEELDERLKQSSSNALVEMGRARQRVELLKAPLLTELTNDFLDEGKSVVLFVNYRETLNVLRDTFKSTGVSLIYGRQPDRQEHIDKFQTHVNPVCVCMVQAGGVGVSLHNTDGDKGRHRVSLITPSFNATEMVQCLGRIWRAGGTKALQIFVLAADTIEERIHQAIQRKMHNLESLNDGDLV